MSVGLCMNLCVYIYILHFVKIWHQGEVLLFTCFSICRSTWISLRLFPTYCTRYRFNSAILWVILKVGKLWQINK